MSSELDRSQRPTVTTCCPDSNTDRLARLQSAPSFLKKRTFPNPCKFCGTCRQRQRCHLPAHCTGLIPLTSTACLRPTNAHKSEAFARLLLRRHIVQLNVPSKESARQQLVDGQSPILGANPAFPIVAGSQERIAAAQKQIKLNLYIIVGVRDKTAGIGDHFVYSSGGERGSEWFLVFLVQKIESSYSTRRVFSQNRT